MSMPKEIRLLVVDDDPRVADFVTAATRGENVTVRRAGSGEEAIAALGSRAADTTAVLLDVRLPGMDGLQTFRLLRERGVEIPVILATSHATMDVAAQAMAEGAWDFVSKPLRVEKLLELLAGLRAERRVRAIDAAAESAASCGLVGQSPAMVEVYKAIGRVARSDATVLILGPSGTGKEMVARAIHAYSGRTGPYAAVNCSAIPETLLESELFGHEKGAFTGADRSRAGRLEQAAGGTFLLDEIGDMPLNLQGKLLRVLETRSVERIGGAGLTTLNARVLAATNRDPATQVSLGQMREDLYYRLAVVTITVPALRDRRDDIPALIDHFVHTISTRLGRPVAGVDPAVYERLLAHDWPGNVRELRNVIERMLVLCRNGQLRTGDVPVLQSELVPVQDDDPIRSLVTQQVTLAQLERRYIERVLAELDWNQSRAATRLGIHRNTLRRKIEEFGLRA
jgi:DNA-binding NtrC family response regulator